MFRLINMFLATIVRLCHLALIAFIVLAPFINSEWLLTMHAIIIPGIMIHWITNNNMCSLSYLESKLTNTPMDITFIARVLHPFFEVNNNMIYGTIIGLWMFSIYRLYNYNYNMLSIVLKKTKDLFLLPLQIFYNKHELQ